MIHYIGKEAFVNAIRGCHDDYTLEAAPTLVEFDGGDNIEVEMSGVVNMITAELVANRYATCLDSNVFSYDLRKDLEDSIACRAI